MGEVITATRPKKPFYRTLYVQVIAAILLGGLIGWLWPPVGTALQPLGDGFIKLIKMMIAPIIFCTVVSGIAGVTNVQKVGGSAASAGLFRGGLDLRPPHRPGGRQCAEARAGFPTAGEDAAKVAQFADKAKEQGVVPFLMNVIPDTVVGAFARGDILQVLLFAILFGLALMGLGEKAGWCVS